MAFGLFKRKDQRQTTQGSVTIESPAEERADQEEKTEAIRASGVDVEETIDQLEKFKKIHKWVRSPQS
jgi:hypothetical protein